MVQTLYARAKETRKKNAKINDEIAVELVKKLDYDFSKADKDNAMTYGVIARTIVLDRMVKQYLEKNANTVVINISFTYLNTMNAAASCCSCIHLMFL